MVSRPMTRADLINQVESKLQDSSNATWTAAELGLLLDDAITEVSEVVPYEMVDVYQIESRTGNSTATSANNLVDTDNSQFLSGDVGKMVYNVNDKTRAVITSYSSTSQVGISKDIFTSGENYEIYNKGCWSKKQINIEDSDDFLWIIGAVYPVLPEFYRTPFANMRNVIEYSRNKIVELDVSFVDDSGVSDADVDVHLYLARQHKLNPNTDLAGEVNNGSGYSAGDTSMAIDGLTDADATVFKDTLFYFTQLGGVTVDSRLLYRVTADAAISSNAATISFFPGLESAITDNDDIAFIGSTLTPELERLIVDIVAGEALMSEGISKIPVVTIGGKDVASSYYTTGERMAEKARAKLRALVDVELRATKVYSRS